MAVPNVAFMRRELINIISQYYLIRDALSGEKAIKAARTTYLPMVNADDTSQANKKRYEAYLTRAVFYNVTRRTLLGLLGQVFMREPVIKLPELLVSVEADATGGGVNLIQLSKKSMGLTLAYSRSGLFVDFPQTEGGATAGDISSGKVRPTINVYSPMEIINWRVIEIGAEERLALVVLYEGFPLSDDGFEVKYAPQFRVLKLDPAGNYIQEIWRDPQLTSFSNEKIMKGNFKLHETLNMSGADGSPLKLIPFMFLGSENNDVNVDNPNFYDLASINIAHYRNSADYEESCHIVGQPTPVATGLTKEWVEEILKGKLTMGSNGGIPLPSGATFDLVQATENTMIKEAMEIKERQMVALGAKLVQQNNVQRTAYETKVEETSESSVLGTTTKNVQDGFMWALKWCAILLGQPDTTIEFQLNTDFDINSLTVEGRNQAITEYESKAITFGEMRSVLRKAGVATEEDAIAKQEIETDAANALELQQKFAPKPAVPSNNPVQ